MIQFAPESSGRSADDAYLHSLLVADWEDPHGPLHLNPNLVLTDLAAATFFQNTRTLLSALAEAEGTAATATGNLNRVFVREMFDRFRLPKPTRQSILKVCKVLNELDIWAVHLARVVSESAGLIVRRSKRFQIPKSARTLLPDGQAGTLFRKLFLAYFRRFDLRYSFYHRDVPGIQETLAIILWRLDVVARDWVPVRGLAPKLLLPGVLNQLRQTMTSPYDTEEWILSGYVLNPLLNLGLIERQGAGGWPDVIDKDSIRLTHVWKKFVSF